MLRRGTKLPLPSIDRPWRCGARVRTHQAEVRYRDGVCIEVTRFQLVRPDGGVCMQQQTSHATLLSMCVHCAVQVQQMAGLQTLDLRGLDVVGFPPVVQLPHLQVCRWCCCCRTQSAHGLGVVAERKLFNCPYTGSGS